MGKPLKERTKVVVRKLPPGLNEQGFKAVVEKLIEGKYTWLSYCEGKARYAHEIICLTPDT